MSVRSTFYLSLGLVVICLAFLLDRTGTPELTLYCAVALGPPVERVIGDYHREFGRKVHVFYGGSGSLLSSLRVVRNGDLFLPAESVYLDLAREQGLGGETFPVCRMTPVLGVQRGNPLRIQGVDDLLRDDVRLGLANPDAAAIGRVCREVLEESGRWEAVSRKAAVFKPTVNDLANDLRLGALDAAVLWDAVLGAYPDLESVPLPEFSAHSDVIRIGVLACSYSPEAASHFAEYLTDPETGLRRFLELGYAPPGEEAPRP